MSIHPDASVHASAIVDDGASIGARSRIWHFVHICSGARIGEGCSLGQNVYVGNDVTIGNNVRIQNNVSVFDAVRLEDDVFCGPSMVFTNVYNPARQYRGRMNIAKRSYGGGATLGANCTIVCGNEIGEYAFVGAGAVVNKPVPSFALMVGVPAIRKGWMCRCGVQLKGMGDVTCACGATYHINDGACTPR